ncbi:hypothetical protein TNCV_803301 [Trichonephila clavipes]|nr:hypothetical protein TNCV_803301 [Trichonephila clavipes]
MDDLRVAYVKVKGEQEMAMLSDTGAQMLVGMGSSPPFECECEVVKLWNVNVNGFGLWYDGSEVHVSERC